MAQQRLSALQVKNLTRPGKYGDGRGSYGLRLVVTPGGTKNFVQQITVRGRRREIGLGPYPLVTLREAREAAFDNARLARAGGDPLEARERERQPTFAEAAEAVVAIHEATWDAGGKSAYQWRATLRDYALPKIGPKRVGDVTAADVLAVLVPIWTAKQETARRVKQRLSAIMKWAAAQGYRTDNPVDGIDEALPRGAKRPTHLKALPYSEVGDAVRRIRGSDAGISVRLALEFIILTAARSGEVRHARWSEFDLVGATWTVPATRMKAKREHRVPLSERGLAVLEEARVVEDGSGLVFPSPNGKPLGGGVLSELVRALGIQAVPHGFRSSFRDWASERTNTPHAVMEAALAHVIPNKAEAAYARSDLFEKRRGLMDAWALYIGDGTAQVVTLDRAIKESARSG